MTEYFLKTTNIYKHNTTSDIIIAGNSPTASYQQKIFDILTYIRNEHIFTRNIPTREENQRALLAWDQEPGKRPSQSVLV